MWGGLECTQIQFVFGVHMCIRRAEVGTGLLPQVISTLFFETSFLLSFGAYQWLEVLDVEPLDSPVSACTAGTEITYVYHRA